MSGAQRTVRLAAVLVIGQVALVAIIGWVIFAYADDGSTRLKTPAVDQLALPPAQVLPAPRAGKPPVGKPPVGKPSTGTPSSGESSPAGTSVSESRVLGPRAHPKTDSTGSAPGRGRTAPVRPRIPLPVAPTPAATSSDPLTLVPPPASSPSPPAATPSPTVSASPTPVLAGRPCPKADVVSRAEDGSTVRCLPTLDHELRWKIV
jgi:hypothetical protein